MPSLLQSLFGDGECSYRLQQIAEKSGKTEKTRIFRGGGYHGFDYGKYVLQKLLLIIPA